MFHYKYYETAITIMLSVDTWSKNGRPPHNGIASNLCLLPFLIRTSVILILIRNTEKAVSLL